MIMSSLGIFLIAFCFLLIWAEPAYAYLDPGSGSMITQIILAGLAGAVVVLKLFWHRLLALFGMGKRKKNNK